MSKTPDLQGLANRVSQNAWFLGNALATYMAAHRLSDRALARFLGCAPAALVRLALCRKPDPEGDRFLKDTALIAKHTGCDLDALVELLSELAKQRAAESRAWSDAWSQPVAMSAKTKE